MSTFFIIFLLFVTADADLFGLFFTNEKGVFFKDNATEKIETVIPYDGGATYVDFNSDKEVYAILGSSNSLSHQIVWVKFPDSSQNAKICGGDLPHWCSNDEACSRFCSSSRFHDPAVGFTPENCIRASNLAVDWVHSTMYWTCAPKDKTNSRINMAYINGSNSVVVKMLDSAKVVDLKVDPYQRKLFWLQKNNEIMTLESSNLEGKEEKKLFKLNTGYDYLTTNLFLDINNKKIHVACNKTKNGLFMDYNGGNVQQMETKLLIQFQNMQIGTHSKLYHPNLQKPNINCSEKECKGACRFLTYKGVHCLNNTAKGGMKQTTPTVVIGTEVNISDSGTSGLLLNTTVSRTEETKTEESKTTVVDQKSQTPAVYLTTDIPRVTGVFTVSSNATTDTNVDKASNTTENLAEPSTTAEAGLTRRAATFFLVAMTIGVAIYFVLVIINRKVKQGNYRPASPEESLTTLNH